MKSIHAGPHQSMRTTSLRRSIALTASLALLAVSVVFIAYVEILGGSQARRYEAVRLEAKAVLVETVLNLYRLRLEALAKRVATDSEVDTSLLAGDVSPGLEDILERARSALPERPVIAILTPKGRILAVGDDGGRVSIYPDILSDAITRSSGTHWIIGDSGPPILVHHALVRHRDQSIGHVLVFMEISDVLIDFFPGLTGLAFIDEAGMLRHLAGEVPNLSLVFADHDGQARSLILPSMDGRQLDVVILPLRDEPGKVIGDILLLRDITAALKREKMLAWLAFFTVLIIILLSLGLLLRSLRLAFRPLGAVVQLLEAMARGETGLRFRNREEGQETKAKLLEESTLSSEEGQEAIEPFSTTSGNEIGVLLNTVERFRASLDAHNALIAIQEQLESARHIQQSLLPVTFDLHPGIDIHGRMRPAQEVGGDFFDVFPLKDGRIVAMIADVSGKGIAAALFASQASAVLSAQCNSTDDPAEAVLLANKALCGRNPEDMFLSAILAVITPETGRVSFINAGHCPPMIAGRDKKAKIVETPPDPVLGVLPELKWTRHQITLAPGERLLFYSDGFDEAQNNDGMFLGMERAMEIFDQTLAEHAELSSETLSRRILNQIDDFSAGAPQADDITLMVVKRGLNRAEFTG